VCQQSEDGAGHERSALHVMRRYATANWWLGEISADGNWPAPVASTRQLGLDGRRTSVRSGGRLVRPDGLDGHFGLQAGRVTLARSRH
jgi:hypothetical protein